MFHEYEIVIIVRPDIDDAETQAACDKVEAIFTEGEGKLLEREDWGRKKLAYTIQKHTKGTYYLWRVLLTPDFLLEWERRVRLDDRIIRFLVVKIAEAVDVELVVEQAEARRAERAAEEARRAAEAEAAGGDDSAAANAD